MMWSECVSGKLTGTRDKKYHYPVFIIFLRLGINIAEIVGQSTSASKGLDRLSRQWIMHWFTQ
jgi:hypothetical protein